MAAFTLKSEICASKAEFDSHSICHIDEEAKYSLEKCLKKNTGNHWHNEGTNNQIWIIILLYKVGATPMMDAAPNNNAFL